MAKQILTQTRFNGGISDAEKEGISGSALFYHQVDIHSDPSKICLLPATTRISSGVVVDAIKWIVSGAPHDSYVYSYGNTGNIYRTAADGSTTLLATIANSVGQGMCVSNDYLYYAQNTQVGRYGPLSGLPTFTDNFKTGLNDTSTTGFAPCIPFTTGVILGHGNKVAQYDGSIWTSSTIGTPDSTARLLLPPGTQIRAIEVIDEFAVIGTWRGTSITDNEESYTFFWDGSAQLANNFVKSEEGGVNALLNKQNSLISFLGSYGNFYQNYSPYTKIQQIPRIASNEFMEVYPGAVTNWRGKSYFGVSNSNATSVIRGVYCYGAKSSKFPNVLTSDYTISTGRNGNTVQIAALEERETTFTLAGKTHQTLRYTASIEYQLQEVFTHLGTLNSSYFDAGNPYNDKLADIIKATHTPLVSGQSVQLGYKNNRASSFTTDTANSTVDTTSTRLLVSSPSKFTEFQIKCILGTSISTSPVLTSLGMRYDDLESEEDY